MRPLARWGALPLIAAPVGAWGLGLGDIELQSALNQPFRAEIEVTATAEELESLEVSLAGQEAFDRYGLFRADFLSSLEFEITQDAAGQDVVVVTSDESITEPFVTMLLEASWARGRLLREYTALLDPPTRLPGSEGPVPVSTPETGGSGERTAGGAIEREPEPQPAPAPEPEPAQPEPAAQRGAEPAEPAPEPQPAAAGDDEGPGTYGPVQRGETLWSIADEFRPSGVSMNQMLVGIYRANPGAFEGNMNVLRSGAILRIPGSSELGDVSASDAAAEVAAQQQSWQGPTGEQQARLRLVPPSEEAAAAGPSGSGEAAGGGEAPAEVAELRDEVESLESELEESQRLIELRDQQLADLQSRLAELEQAVDEDGAPVDAGAGAEAEAEAEAAVAEAAPAADETSAETPADARPADGDAAEDSPFADEAAGGAAAAAAGGSDAPADGSGGGAEPAGPDAGSPETGGPDAEAGAASGADAPAEPAASGPEPATAAEPSLLGRVLGWLSQPFVWIGLGIAAVLLAGLGFVRRRRAEVDDVTGRWEALEAEVEAEEAAGAEPSATARLRRQADPAAQDFVVEETEPASQADALDEATLEDSAAPREAPAMAASAEPAPERSVDDTLSNQTVMNLDQADPVAEADFHMAYGLYDQAADLMTKALENDPGNRSYKLKLLEVYFVWGNKEAFLETARSLRGDIGDAADADWDKVIIMGKQICPDEPMFADAQAAAGEVDLDLEAGGSGGLDFAFGDESEPAAGAGDEASNAIDEIFGSTDDDVDLSLEATAEREPEHQSGRDAPDDPDVLELGATTAAGLESAFADQAEADGSGAPSAHDSGGEAYESLDPTQESPTIEQPRAEDDDEWAITTQESPTIESSAYELPDDASGDESTDWPDDGAGADADRSGWGAAAEYGGSGAATERGDTGVEPAEADSRADATGADETSVSSIFSAPAFDEDTAESPTLEHPGASETSRVQTLEQPAADGDDADATGTGWASGAGMTGAEDTSRVPQAEQPAESGGSGSGGSGEYTAELDLDDLGLDVSDFDRLPGDLGDAPAASDAESDTREQPAVDAEADDDQLLTASGVTQVLGEDDSDYESASTSVLGDDDRTMMAPGAGSSADSTGQHAAAQDGGEGLDFDLGAFDGGGDEGGDTVEQPQIRSFDGGGDADDIFAASFETPVDLDVGTEAGGDDSPTDRSASGDAQTMTEVGTKLDLARAYIDMGDPEGARSILEEVLDEGDSGQRNEAQTLIESLTA